MGQYYKGAFIDLDFTIRTIHPKSYGNFGKLAEHGWLHAPGRINGKVGDAAATLIWKNPMRVLWIGDYSKNKTEYAYENVSHRLSYRSYAKIYREVMYHPQHLYAPNDSDETPEPCGHLTVDSPTYLINHDKRIFMSVQHYAAAYMGEDENLDEEDRDFSIPSIPNPLICLTAVGCGLGSGDFDHCHEIGSWAYDLIECSDAVPEGYQEETYHFLE